MSKEKSVRFGFKYPKNAEGRCNTFLKGWGWVCHGGLKSDPTERWPRLDVLRFAIKEKKERKKLTTTRNECLTNEGSKGFIQGNGQERNKLLIANH